MHLALTASSSALFSTWFFVEEFGVLFDAGDGVSAALKQRSRKVKHIFVTHADRDHVAGLLQLHQLNARDGMPVIYYPRDCGSFPALKAFVEKFDPQSGPAAWRGLVPGDVVELGGNISVKAGHSDHVPGSANQVKALMFTLSRGKKVLKDEYKKFSASQIAELKRTLGQAALTVCAGNDLLGYSGDSPTLDPRAWGNVRLLIHECTFLKAETAKRPHSNLTAVLEAAKGLSLEALVLAHFSARYSRDEIIGAIGQVAGSLGLSFPVYAVIPGEVCENILDKSPAWQPPRTLTRRN
jgi:ribonuclease Z